MPAASAPGPATAIRPITIIRPAGPADLPDLLRLINLLDPPGTPLMDLASAEALLRRIDGIGAVWLVLEEDDTDSRLVGTYTGYVLPNLGHRGTPAAVVESVAVAEDCRGHGLGRLMMAHAIEQARLAGCYKVALSSNLVRTTAHAFYEHLGFQRHGYSFLVETAAVPAGLTPEAAGLTQVQQASGGRR